MVLCSDQIEPSASPSGCSNSLPRPKMWKMLFKCPIQGSFRQVIKCPYYHQKRDDLYTPLWCFIEHVFKLFWVLNSWKSRQQCIYKYKTQLVETLHDLSVQERIVRTDHPLFPQCCSPLAIVAFAYLFFTVAYWTTTLKEKEREESGHHQQTPTWNCGDLFFEVRLYNNLFNIIMSNVSFLKVPSH